MQPQSTHDPATPYHSEPYTFSTPLKLRLVTFFRTSYELDISDEEADLYLRTLSTVYDCLSQNAALLPTNQPSQNRGAGEVGGGGGNEQGAKRPART